MFNYRTMIQNIRQKDTWKELPQNSSDMIRRKKDWLQGNTQDQVHTVHCQMRCLKNVHSFKKKNKKQLKVEN